MMKKRVKQIARRPAEGRRGSRSQRKLLLMTHIKMQDDAEQQPPGSQRIRRRLEVRVFDGECSFEAEEVWAKRSSLSNSRLLYIPKIVQN